MAEGGALDGRTVEVGGQLQVETRLAVEGDGIAHGGFDEVLFVVVGPCGVADGRGVAQRVP